MEGRAAAGSRSSSRLIVGLIALALALPLDARADDAAETSALAEARAAFSEAQAAYNAGDLEAARAKLERAHRLAPSAELSYDLARVHERMGDAAKAIALYREYLDTHRVSDAEVAKVAKAIASLEALAKRQGDALRAPPPDAALLDAEARAMFARGIDAFRAKRYEVALAAFVAARSIAPLPELDYNLARSCEELGLTRDAIDHYRAYLHHASPDEAAATRSRIAALQAALKIEAKSSDDDVAATDPQPRPTGSKRPRPRNDPRPR